MAAADGLHAQEAAAQVEQRDGRRVRRPNRQPGATCEATQWSCSAFFQIPRRCQALNIRIQDQLST